MDDVRAKRIASFFSIPIIALITWALSFCCFFAYYHCLKPRVERHDEGVHTKITLPKSGVNSAFGEYQIKTGAASYVYAFTCRKIIGISSSHEEKEIF